jgi:hypothetical protein
MTTIKLTLSDREAMALAQMVKRFSYQDAVKLSTPHDGGKERDAMIAGVCSLQRALNAAGFNPR